MASFHTCRLAASLYVEGFVSMSLLIRPEYLWGFMLSLKVLGGALCFSASCNVSQNQAGLLLEGGASSSSSGGLSDSKGAFGT